MKIPLYLAMTAAEFAACNTFPEKIGWMACHFSPYCRSLSNIPASLPPGSLLIVNDITPINGHDPKRIYDTLESVISTFQCDGLLLDFQREGSEQTAAVVKKLLELPSDVCVSEKYAKDLSCPVFLPPPPIRKKLEEYLSPWESREIWLEAALSRECICVTPEGSNIRDDCDDCQTRHPDHTLHCHYGIKTDDNHATFHLERTENDLINLLHASAQWGVSRAVGLYQELKDFPLFISPNL